MTHSYTDLRDRLSVAIEKELAVTALPPSENEYVNERRVELIATYQDTIKDLKVQMAAMTNKN